ncbi:MAG: peptidase domain-containing ABC transporter [Chitinophagales bacterium]
MKKFPLYRQLDSSDGGITCLRMVAKYYGKKYSLRFFKEKYSTSKAITSLKDISILAEDIGLNTIITACTFEKLKKSIILPCIVKWNRHRTVVVYKITKKKVYVADPYSGYITYDLNEFAKNWLSTITKGDPKGLILQLETTPKFENTAQSQEEQKKVQFFQPYFSKYKKYFVQLLFGILGASLLQLVSPFLTQSIVDIGIKTSDINFIYLIVVAQFMIILGKTTIDFIRNWIVLHISTRIKIFIISDFLKKLIKLPISFFETKKMGDLMQRISDQRRIEAFYTTSTLDTLFSLINIFIFGIILLIYNSYIFFVFLIGSILHILWIVLFFNKRKELDFKIFRQSASNQNTLIQIFTGIQEIKLNNYGLQKRWEWESIQAELFKIHTKILALEQYQQIGVVVFSELKNIIIILIAAQSVVLGEMTLGMMMAVMYITGQLNSPISQISSFLKKAQDAHLSIERLIEVHRNDDENKGTSSSHLVSFNENIEIKNLYFSYDIKENFVLKNVSITIPNEKVTAIVGASGSGKTTLLKLLLKLYQPTKGSINIGNVHLTKINHDIWRQTCGVVMQDGFIFSDSIAKNIVLDEEDINKEILIKAVEMANIRDFIETLPENYNTKIGRDGRSLSGGQKQRILIARAIYKNPNFLFFDEATSALDARNERIIVDNLNTFYKGKTVLIVAHRLSTVQNADQIIVLDNGQIVETGTHNELISLKGEYYRLVRNQLALG